MRAGRVRGPRKDRRDPLLLVWVRFEERVPHMKSLLQTGTVALLALAGTAFADGGAAHKAKQAIPRPDGHIGRRVQ